MKNRAQRAQQQNRARASPSGTACLIRQPGLMEPVLKRFSASSCFPSSAKTSQMGVSIPATPKYKTSRPKIPPQRTQQRAQPPACHIWHCCHLFTSAPYPCSTPPPYDTPPPSHPAPSAYPIHLPAHPKNPICHPNEPRLSGIHPGLLCFLGGGISPIYIDHV
jgi:hypothetical protein